VSIDNEAGSPPEPLDIESIVGPEEDSEAIDLDAVAEIGSDVSRSVEKPSYEVLPPESTALRPGSPKRPVKQGGEVLEGNFSADATVPQYLHRTMEEWGRVRKWLHGRDVRKVERKQVLALTKALLDYQYQDMQHQMMLSMDVQKKRRFAQYLAATGPLQSLIQNQSAEAQLSIANNMFENRFEAYRTKNERDVALRKMLEEGRIDRRQYDKSLRDNESYSDEHVDRLDETARIMIQRHMEFLYKTLELFQTKLIEKGLA
jgi:hypothetical protein